MGLHLMHHARPTMLGLRDPNLAYVYIGGHLTLILVRLLKMYLIRHRPAESVPSVLSPERRASEGRRRRGGGSPSPCRASSPSPSSNREELEILAVILRVNLTLNRFVMSKNTRFEIPFEIRVRS